MARAGGPGRLPGTAVAGQGRTGPDGLRDAVLRSLGASERPDAAIAGQLPAALPSEPALLVLGNCEHVLEAAATMIGGLLARSLVTVLATPTACIAVGGASTATSGSTLVAAYTG
jgi:predicted ATPase